MSNFIYYEKLEDYEKQVKKAKLCNEKGKEIERLNNIINEFERWLEEMKKYYGVGYYDTSIKKLQELKGSESNE